MPRSRVNRRGRLLLAEQLECRRMLSATVDALPLSTAAAASFTTGLAETAADRPWMIAAADGSSGAAVIWMRVDVSGGQPAIQTLPIWGRLNPPGSVDPALAGDAAQAFASTTTSVFGSPDGDSIATGPMTTAEFAASAASWHEGVQDFFVVIRSPSDLAVTAMTAGYVLAGAPGLPAPTPGDASADPPAIMAPDGGTAAPNEDSSLALHGMLALARRPVPREGLLPADEQAAAWLQDARGGSTGGIVLWLSPAAATDQLPRVVPLFARFNPETDQDPAFGQPENRQTSARFHPADGAASFPVPTETSASDPWSSLGDAATSGGFLVVHTDSNVEIAFSAMFSILFQAPASWLGPDGTFVGADVMNTLSVAAGTSDPPPAPAVSLANDTGSSATDQVTADGRLTVVTVPGATPHYSTDGGRRWTDDFSPREGRNDVLVRQVTPLGGQSSATPFTFTLDTTAPPAPKATLAGQVYGRPAAAFRRRGDLSLRRVERAARVEYALNDAPWASSWTAVEGPNALRIRQVDVAGNTSAASPPLRFQLKTRVAAPTVTLARDTGRSSTDRITADPRLALGGIERGAVAWYSSDGGRTWKRNFSPSEGRNVVLVRQIDSLGNVSAATRFEFTLDRTRPNRPGVRQLTAGLSAPRSAAAPPSAPALPLP